MFKQIYFRSFPKFPRGDTLSRGQRRRQTIAAEHSFHTYSPAGAFVRGNTATHSQINVNLWHHKGTNFTHHTSTFICAQCKKVRRCDENTCLCAHPSHSNNCHDPTQVTPWSEALYVSCWLTVSNWHFDVIARRTSRASCVNANWSDGVCNFQQGVNFRTAVTQQNVCSI